MDECLPRHQLVGADHDDQEHGDDLAARDHLKRSSRPPYDRFMTSYVGQCVWCGKHFSVPAKTPLERKRYCSDAHRLAAWRFRQTNPEATVWGQKP